MLCGIVAEYNPLHNGHVRQLCQSRLPDTDGIVVVMSGNFVQRGEPAICHKTDRAAAAVACGADLVIELPALWAVAGAERFAAGAVALLAACGVGRISFGSECGSVEQLLRTAEILSQPACQQALRENLRQGGSYPAAAARAVGACGEILSNPNDTLAVAYIRAARRIGLNCDFQAVPRVGAAHDSPIAGEGFISGSALRARLTNGQPTDGLMPKPMQGAFEQAVGNGAAPARLQYLERAMIARLSMASPEALRKIPDVTEGLENRIIDAARHAADLQQLYAAIKSKRYTHARIRRIALNACLEADAALYAGGVPYLRPLAFNETGRGMLKRLSETAPLPVFVKSSRIAREENCRAVFALERRAGLLYRLCVPDPTSVPDELQITPKKV